jgi:hypothetical protein
MRRMTNAKRGRPTKFGRASRVVALTLPEDVLSTLRHVHPDPARAIVKREQNPPLPVIGLPHRRCQLPTISLKARSIDATAACL